MCNLLSPLDSIVFLSAIHFLYFAKFITLTFSSFLNGNSHDIKIYPLTDGSGYYVTGRDASSRANIWKYRDFINNN